MKRPRELGDPMCTIERCCRVLRWGGWQEGEEGGGIPSVVSSAVVTVVWCLN